MFIVSFIALQMNCAKKVPFKLRNASIWAHTVPLRRTGITGTKWCRQEIIFIYFLIFSDQPDTEALDPGQVM
jgi:hypothetical protein